ncbi:DUF6902 family protein [Antarcticimicrobium luteum]|uniref:Uncharacterized protein n=1 Tax=Antarcticimicrobium luteum TaxID=2547397 RepID=A0A4R5VGA2_9RHOB|nr:hypothetical protein [Antarcticimicrobium luteum]TDK51953.1 hypothetical protein E1832_02145 [Antarcticimicrobium luteum]
MSNVVRLNVPPHRQGRAARHAALLGCFAGHRRGQEDVFWLKENAELLNILECTGARPGPAALAPLAAFYDSAESRLSFFPQYYRFILSICLDLEDLGLPGDKGAALCAWTARQGLAGAELSDLQRAEARRLMARRGARAAADDGLEARLRAFIGRSETFALPNKKAAYELTHIVFYLSEYGRRDPELDLDAVTSLEFAGLLAYLDQNADLLAEICIALRYAGRSPSPIWEHWLEGETHRFDVAIGPPAGAADDYHAYFVNSWLLALRGGRDFVKPAEPGPMSFYRPPVPAAPLRQMSHAMFRLDAARSRDWTAMRPHVAAALSEIGRDILTEAEASSDRFGEFFAGFARAGGVG